MVSSEYVCFLLHECYSLRAPCLFAKKCMYCCAKPTSSNCVVPAWKCLVMVANSMLAIICACYNVKRKDQNSPTVHIPTLPLLSHWAYRVPEWTLLSFPALPCPMTLVDLFNATQTAGTRITQNPSTVEHKQWVVVPSWDPHPLGTWLPFCCVRPQCEMLYRQRLCPSLCSPASSILFTRESLSSLAFFCCLSLSDGMAKVQDANTVVRWQYCFFIGVVL